MNVVDAADAKVTLVDLGARLGTEIIVVSLVLASGN